MFYCYVLLLGSIVMFYCYVLLCVVLLLYSIMLFVHAIMTCFYSTIAGAGSVVRRRVVLEYYKELYYLLSYIII